MPITLLKNGLKMWTLWIELVYGEGKDEITKREIIQFK